MLAVITAILLAAHLVLVDVAMMGPLFAVWLDWRGNRRGESETVELGRQMALWALAALLLGSLLGGVLLALRYQADDGYFAAAAVIPTDRLWFALVELLFSLVCLGIYAGLWNRWRKGRVWHRLLAVAAATNLLAHFPALFVIISVINSQRPLPGGTLDRAAYQRLLVDGEVLSRVVHLWLAAGAITGMFLVLLALRKKGSAESPAYESLVRAGARLTLAFAMLQFPVGLWVALAMPAALRGPLLGGDALAALLFLASLMLAMLLLHVVSPLALGTIEWRPAWRGFATLVALILLMVSVRVRLDGLEKSIVRTTVERSDGAIDGAGASGPLALADSSVSIGGLCNFRLSPTREVACLDVARDRDHFGPRVRFEGEDSARPGVQLLWVLGGQSGRPGGRALVGAGFYRRHGEAQP